MDLSVVVPLYNEEESVEALYREVRAAADRLGRSWELLLIDDGSTDATAAVGAAWAREPGFRLLQLSRNFGKEAAMTAGLDACQSDAAIPIDVDLQDPPSVIPLLVAKWREGFDVVLAKRADRSSDGFLKRYTASMFYRLHNLIASQEIPPNVGDFRLVDRQVIDALRQLPERRRFMKGLFAWVGFKTTVVEYVREARVAGHSKFSGWRLWNFALEGITSFSSVPLEIWTYVGASISLASFGYGLLTIFKTLYFGVEVPGYASLLVSMLFLGGIQLIGIGILGQYLGRVYAEIKQRPIYIVRRDLAAQAPQDNLVSIGPRVRRRRATT